MNRPAVIVGALVICAIAVAVYFQTRMPPSVTAMDGDNSLTIAWVSLAIALLSLMTAVVGLIQKFVELRAAKDG